MNHGNHIFLNIMYLVALLLLTLIIFSKKSNATLGDTSVCNNVDSRCYDVISNYNNTQEASEVLAKINLFCIDFIEHLRNKYVYGGYSGNGRRAVDLLLLNYNPDSIVENNPINDVNTSYVSGKGKVFALCLREKLSGKNNFHSINELKFVILHELAHMANPTFGHDVSFWTTFKFFITEAHVAGMYMPIDHSVENFNYCSLLITYSPYFSPELADWSEN